MRLRGWLTADAYEDIGQARDLMPHTGVSTGEETAVRVLLVEDEQSLAKALVRGLGAEGFAVDHASDGAEGYWQAKEYPYDVIVLDIMLPKMNGYDVARRLRDAGVWTPILMLTAKDGEYDE